MNFKAGVKMNTNANKNRSNYVIKIICIALCVLMLISILPALILCFYTFPSPGDDYSNSISVFNEWQETHSFSFITVALKHAAERYMNWQGTLSA